MTQDIDQSNTEQTLLADETLETAKRERQARSRALVQSGARTQESMFLIPPEVARKAKIRHRVLSFDTNDQAAIAKRYSGDPLGTSSA